MPKSGEFLKSDESKKGCSVLRAELAYTFASCIRGREKHARQNWEGLCF